MDADARRRIEDINAAAAEHLDDAELAESNRQVADAQRILKATPLELYPNLMMGAAALLARIDPAFTRTHIEQLVRLLRVAHPGAFDEPF